MRICALAAGALVVLLGAGCLTPGPHAHRPPRPDAIEVRGAWLRFRDTGPRDGARLPVILLHGYGSRLETWQAIQDALSSERRVVSFDLRGFGHSERPPGPYGPEVHARDTLALMDALGIERAVLFGHSYGGGVALRIAVEAPERVAGLLLVSAFALESQLPPAFRWAKQPGLGELLFSAFYQELPGEKYLLAFHDRRRFVTLERIEEIKTMMKLPGSAYAALQTVRGMHYADVEEAYSQLDLPIRIVWGKEDRVLPVAQGEALAAHLDAPLVVLPACGHVPPWERPKALLREARRLLSEVEP
ncbi:MAG: alpha/beta fold hydrolase [Deltaproteobacteria bacterium]|nr:MAG: alpha/beta fold hydrolase [Deltaproteobacteria bacterium]